MIEDEKTACNHEDHLGQLQFIALRWRNLRLEEVNGFVAEKTDGAAAESREFRTRDRPIARHQFADLVQWIACHCNPPLRFRLQDSKFPTVAFYHDSRIAPHKGEASRYIILFRRFKEEAVTIATQF